MTGVGWSVWGGSAAGSAHLRHGGDCEDAYGSAREGGTLVLTVADGASGARLGGVGARVAVQLALRTTATLLRTRPPGGRDPAGYWRAFAHQAAADLARGFTATQAGVSRALDGGGADGEGAADLATTLVLAVIRHPWVAVCGFGDCFAVIQADNGHLDLLSAEGMDSADGAAVAAGPGSTVFLADPRAAQRTPPFAACLPGLAGIALSTDGLADVAVEYDRSIPLRPHGDFFRPMFDQARDERRDDGGLARWLAGRQLSGRTEDDKTLLIAVRTP
jgi:Protein phosphatase 2C